MATPYRIKRSAVPGKRPLITDLLPGELALNTYDAELLTRRDRPGIGTDIVRLGAGATVTNIVYVTKDGNDTNTGLKLGDAKATIKGAVAISTEGTVIKVSAGTYIEDNPIILPNQVSVVGDSLREVTVTPANQADLFWVGAGNYVAEMSYLPLNGESLPYAIFAFDPIEQRYINQSPYIQNCTNFIPESIGLKVNGENALGPLKSMVLDSYTQFNPSGVGASMTNEGYAQLVSLFTICPNIAVYCGTGGACDLTNSNASFGNFGLVAEGVSPLKYTGVSTAVSAENVDQFTLDLGILNPTLGIVTAKYDNVSGLLTAYTDAPHNFNVGMGITITGLEFSCPFEVGIRTYPSGAYGYVFEIKTVAPGRYVDASNLIIGNKTEIQDKALASIALNHPDFIFPDDPGNDSRYRYYDSYRLIQQNKQEIVDKSLASIAVGFPSAFSFPDDPVPYEQNRYYDASGLIQNNKQEIVDKSIGAIAINHPDFYFPTDDQTNSRSRYFDSYRLIQNNKDVIVSVAWTNTYNVYPGVATSETKCKRDIGFFIDAISTDILTGGNEYSRQFALQYFDGAGNPITNGLLGEETESNYAFVQARELMKQAITNTLAGADYQDLTITADPLTGSNTDPASCADVQTNIDNLVGIVTSVISAGSTSSLPNSNYGYFNVTVVGVGSTSSPGGFKCARDLGYLVDALATDVFLGANRYVRDFSLQYFDNNGNPISAGLTGEEVESITAFHAARDYSKKAITNQLNFKNLGISSGPANYGGGGGNIPVDPSGNANSCTDVQAAIDTLVGIVTVTIGAGNTLSLPSINSGISTTNKCARDLGYFVDAISTDVFTGGNTYSIAFTKFYFDNVGSATTALLGEETESVYSFASARDYMKSAITNQLNVKDLTVTADPVTGFNTDPSSCANVRTNIDTLVGIVTQAITAGNLTTLNSISLNSGSFTDGGSKCRRDIGYIVDAVALDVRDFTNKNIINATRAYFTSSGEPLADGLVGEEAESITAFHAVRDLSKKAINNLLNFQDLSIAVDPITLSNQDPASCANVQTTIDNLVGILTTTVGLGTLTSLPNVSMASTEFSINVGIATQLHTYESGGEVKINVVRPFDGQVVYFGDLYYTVGGVQVSAGGTGYLDTPIITIEDPDTEFGIPAQAVGDIRNGSVTLVEMVSTGRGYTRAPRVTVTSPDVGINTAVLTPIMIPTYYFITDSTELTPTGICTITVSENVPYEVGIGTTAFFFKQSRVLASGQAMEYIGTGVTIASALPQNGGVRKQENETDAINGGLVVFTSTDQSGNFRIGDGVVINQQTGTISGTFYSKSLFSTLTPFILALGGE